MPTVRRLLPLGAMLAALAIAGCGSSEGEIPRDEADALNETLAALQEQGDADPCSVSDDSLNDLFSEINALPDRVDQDIVDGLDRLARQLEEIIQNDCSDQEDTTSTSTTDETTTTTESTTETTDTTDTTTDTTDEPIPPGNGPDGNGPPGQTDSGGGISPRQGGGDR
jgi:hypothetical protein